MQGFENNTISTPKKAVSAPEEFYLIENIEKELENFSHLLERSEKKGMPRMI